MTRVSFGKLLLILLLAYTLSHLAIYFSENRVTAAFDSVLVTFNFLMPTVLAASWGIFTYVDNMAKELTDLRNDVDRKKYVVVQESLAAFKSEIIANAFMVFVLFLMQKIIASIFAGLGVFRGDKNVWLIETIALSVQMSLFTISIVAALIQIRAFLTAVEYRTLIAINRK